jgi:hypothetical protein
MFLSERGKVSAKEIGFDCEEDKVILAPRRNEISENKPSTSECQNHAFSLAKYIFNSHGNCQSF